MRRLHFFGRDACALRPLEPPPGGKRSENESSDTLLYETACRALQSDKKLELQLRELEAQALPDRKDTGPHSECEESNLEVSDSENESDVEFN